MGTSSSNTGPESGIPYDPPWLDDIPLPSPPGTDPNEPDKKAEPLLPPDEEPSPPRRFYGARRNLKLFVNTGDRKRLNKALGHFSHTGMGGAKTTARRMRISTQTGAGLFSFLQETAAGTNPAVSRWVESLTSRNASANEIIEEIINSIAPGGGSLDEVSTRNSIALAFQDLLLKNPEVDLLHMEKESIWSFIGSFLGYELFHRVLMDIGQSFENSSLPPQEIELRRNQMLEYIITDLNVCIDNIRQSNLEFSDDQMDQIFQEVYKRTVEIYEEEL